MERIALLNETRICPECGEQYSGYPALSRRDNNTLICPTCGIRESLEDWGYSTSKASRIAEEIQEAMNEKGYTE